MKHCLLDDQERISSPLTPHFADREKARWFLKNLPKAAIMLIHENTTNEAIPINVLHSGAAPIALTMARLAKIRETVEQFTEWNPNNLWCLLLTHISQFIFSVEHFLFFAK